MRKLRLVAVVLSLAFLAACVPPTADVTDIDENVEQSKEALCFTTPTDTPPPANVVVSGWNNEVTSGTTSYGSGPCDGYVVRFNGPLYDTRGARIYGRMGGEEPTESACNETKTTIWVWSKFNGLPWRFHGSDTVTAQWWSGQNGFCNQAPAYVNVGSALGRYQVVVKAQVRTEHNGTPYSYAFNRPVRVAANEQ